MILAETPGNTRKHMAIYPASQPPKITELTLADVLAAVQAADLPNQHRQELASALRTVGRALDRPLERIQGDPRHLAQRLKAVAPAQSVCLREAGLMSAPGCGKLSA